MTAAEETTPPDVIWGCSAIAKVIGRSERATFHLLKNQLFPAKRVGGRWCASRRKLIAALTGDGRREPPFLVKKMPGHTNVSGKKEVP